MAGFIHYKASILSGLEAYSNWMRNNFWLGTAIYIIVFIIIQPLMIPPNVFVLLGAVTYSHSIGFFQGIVLTWIIGNSCQFVGGIIIFFGARYFFKERIQRWLLAKPKMAALNRALSKNAKKLVCLIRMISILPQHMLTNLCGVSDMSFKNYLAGQFGMLICDVPTIYAGASMSSLAGGSNDDEGTNWVNTIAMIFGFVMVIVVIGIITYYANKEV